MVEHNLGKYHVLKKAFYLTALEQLEGDYLEFGVFTGSSFIFSTKVHRSLSYLGGQKTRFFGFDSFSGFGDIHEHDKHPFYLNNIFKVNKDKVIRNIKNKTQKSETRIVEGYFNETLRGKKASDYGIEKARIIFIDCDLKEPAREALAFSLPALQQGTVIVLDDYFSYKGDSTLGVCGALTEVLQGFPGIKLREVCPYGYGGIVFIVSSLEGSNINEKS
ncbi:MAG: class I SAM-dependent methyltransferase [Candidatus Omnitrophica bacterium]|nr:class I SAM-dependent methyltransferase [Candidatus Omnitrophota bacterium]